ncbi:gephyrin-like molybdotransferase Glp [Arthrobacter sp. NPDC090010]|uniref:molybdopterin molybdotransferase MoeA n=1 Tax=Arthrobacter sp. NPDC090010 TaxID=3363942 RepID=UPI00380C0938
MIPVDEHLSRVLAAALPLPPQRVPLADALGLLLAEDVHHRRPVPSFDNSAMDGYAVRRQDAVDGSRLRVVADLPAGTAQNPRMGPGEAVRIMTGAPVPDDADAVVPLEHTEEGLIVSPLPPATVTVLRQPAPGAHIRRTGEHAPAGGLAVGKGTRLGPWQLSAVASAGYATVRVTPRPRVAVISTGSELIHPDETPARGQIPESNSVLLSGAVRQTGAILAGVAVVPDDEDALRKTIDSFQADVLVLSGGASVGSFDVVKAVLDGAGSIRFDALALKPGKPHGFGTLNGRLVFCLPGNPLSAAAGFELFVRPALLSLAGETVLDGNRVRATVTSGWHSPAHKTQLVPGVLNGTEITPLRRRHGGPADEGASMNAFILIPAETHDVLPGASVSVLVIP